MAPGWGSSDTGHSRNITLDIHWSFQRSTDAQNSYPSAGSTLLEPAFSLYHWSHCQARSPSSQLLDNFNTVRSTAPQLGPKRQGAVGGAGLTSHEPQHWGTQHGLRTQAGTQRSQPSRCPAPAWTWTPTTPAEPTPSHQTPVPPAHLPTRNLQNLGRWDL